MLVQNGIDLVRIERIKKAVQRLGKPFLQRIWTAEELADCQALDRQISERTAASLAARFAAKEATAKALGTGLGRQGVCWLDISVYRAAGGQPQLKLAGAALKTFEAQGGLCLSISLTHEAGLALAQCVILKKAKKI